MRIKLVDIPPDLTVQYSLEDKAIEDVWVYMEMQKATYGLPQAGLLAHKQLKKYLGHNGYQ